ncbi:HipA domain-containing protein [Rhizobium sp. MHM7A]|uniref:type II toxin-antitoxin system HipA family toxin n=1 Tax=Rhizobium sp. MHM7A TaxID=2583233 RepID=UPI0011060993|nr:HipA domain-containing protein [Rhizobium sp. MHM7A]TLX16030.1 type II toxin-antitoxin system HipA family toxin [Rhizobium sp. MHM7A]
MDLEFEIFHNGTWNLAGRIKIQNPALGFLGASTLSYDLDYWLHNAAIETRDDKVIRDLRAASIVDPVDLENHHRKTWPPFMLDLLPSGRARVRLGETLRIDPNARSSDIPLLLRAGGSPVGNVRIRDAAAQERARLADVERLGVTREEMFLRSDRFIEIVDYFAIIASGSSGLQGEWPKVAMTQATDGLYYPDPLVGDDEAIDHVIVKLLRSNNPRDEMILRSEAIYSKLAEHLGLNVFKTSDYGNGVLVIPRFDRRLQNGRVIRLGQESFVSALNVAEFGYLGRHEAYIELIKGASSAPFEDVVEYVKREVTNQALGNSDNHGRNTAFSKTEDLDIRLSPLFDFAPMRLAPESIPRSTRWHSMLDKHSDHAPEWRVISEVIFPDDAALAARLLEELETFAEQLQEVPLIAKALGVDDEVLKIAMGRCDEIVRGLETPKGL